MRFGGGARDIEVRVIKARAETTHVVLHLLVNVGDAMGANAVNTMAEALAPRSPRSRAAVSCCASSPTRPTDA